MITTFFRGCSNPKKIEQLHGSYFIFHILALWNQFLIISFSCWLARDWFSPEHSEASMQTLFVHCTMLDEIITLIVPWTAGSEMVKTEVQLSQECLGYSK